MPQSSAYDTQTRKLIKDPPDKKSRVIFDFLLKHKKQWYTQKQLSEILNISSSTVNKEINDLLAKGVFTYRKREYKLYDGGYIYRLTDAKLELVDKDTKEIKNKLSNNNIWLSESADIINSHVILYRINTRYSQTVRKCLLALHGNSIYDIVRDNEKMYIILNDIKDESELEKISNQIYGLYHLNSGFY